jgi:serine/threonine protein kinase
MVGPNGDFDHVLDDVPDGDDNDDGDVNMQDNDAGERAAPPENNGSRHNRDIDDEPPLEGYQRTDLIGQGAYGIVYKGIRQRTNETVAIKRIPFADSTPEGGVPCNVIREISLLRELDHPNVVQLLDIIQAHPGGLYLVFEYVAFDLKTFMDQQQTSDDISERVGLPVATVRSFMRQILAGVGFCHTYRVLHRDLKPHNLLISADGTQLKLADFGLARLSAIPNGPYTFEVVTLWYRAPELLLGANRYSTSVDVWSIGCIFAEMATGMPLFPGRSDIDQLFKIFQRRGTPTADMWPAVLRLPHYNPEFPHWREHPITDFVSQQALGSGNAADLLTKLLQYDPERRLACKAALQHPYFFEQ